MPSTPPTLTVATHSDLEIVMTRPFSAPQRLVWKAMTTPDLVRRWFFAPPGWTMTTCEMDVRTGGAYRWEWNGPDGQLAMTIHGVHREVVPYSRIVHTEHMEMGRGGCPTTPSDAQDWPPILNTMELIEQGASKTLMRLHMLFTTKEARDGAAASGMEHGMSAGYATLDAMLAKGLTI